jgi:hypothetical protein
VTEPAIPRVASKILSPGAAVTTYEIAMSRMPFETVLKPAFSVKPCSGPVPDVGNGSTATLVAGNAEAVPDAVEEYEKLLNVRPLGVEKVFPFDVATIS